MLLNRAKKPRGNISRYRHEEISTTSRIGIIPVSVEVVGTMEVAVALAISDSFYVVFSKISFKSDKDFTIIRFLLVSLNRFFFDIDYLLGFCRTFGYLLDKHILLHMIDLEPIPQKFCSSDSQLHC